MSRQEDAEVAEKIFGYRPTCPIDDKCDHAFGVNRDGSSAKRNFCLVDGAEQVIQLYTTDPSADYEVLKYVREKWDWERQKQFAAEIQTIHGQRTPLPLAHTMFYEPGDYSKAALAVVRGE